MSEKPPTPTDITDDTHLAELTVGQFRQLLREMLQDLLDEMPAQAAAEPERSLTQQSQDRQRMTLDELMNE